MYEIVELYSFTATHQILGLSQGHPCTGVHSHRWVVEFVLTATKLMPTDGPSEQVVLEPLRKYLESGLNGKHLNDLLPGAPTPARMAWHLAVWCQSNLAVHGPAALTAVVVSAGAGSRVRYTVPRVPSAALV